MPPRKKGTAATKPAPSSIPSDTKAADQQVENIPPSKLLEINQKDDHQPEEEQEIALERGHGTDTPRSARSWYGPWSKKSKESIVPDSSSQQENVKRDTRSETGEANIRKGTAASPRDIPVKRKPLLSPGNSVRSLPLAATITKLNISSETSKPSTAQEPENTKSDPVKEDQPQSRELDASDQKAPSTPKLDDAGTAKTVASSITAAPTSWLSWGRGDRPFYQSVITSTPVVAGTVARGQDASPKAVESADNPDAELHQPSQPTNTSPDNKSEAAPPPAWYSKWALGTANITAALESVQSNAVKDSTPTHSNTSTTETTENVPIPQADAKRTGWAFWSSSTSQGNDASGQMAVVDSSSQAKAEPASAQEGLPVPQEDRKKRPLSQPDEPAKKKQAPSTSEHTKKVEEKLVNERPNILLPTFESTYPIQTSASSIWEQIGNWIYPKHNTKHPLLIKDPRKIKHALAIGVHGYFPASIVQTVLGKPTGTSIKFADSAAKAIEDFTQGYGYAPQSIDKIALEGEGRIDERLEILWKLLLNWIDLIRKADFVLVACHSQGVPVAISLVAKLIGFGCVSEARIGICAMAGISRGPFLEYKSRWIGGSAAELFEFSDPQSAVSRAYRDSLETVLRFGAKVVYVGSLDDQLVPLHSSTFIHVNHPNIYRAVFVDGRIHVADFISHLVGFALKLRNLNTSDHSLIKELSSPLAGSLVGGEGHSRIYDDPAVYRLAMDFTLRTSDVIGKFESDDTPTPTAINPFILPFAMRGVLEEDIVRQELSGEVIELLKQFDHWKPATKVLRDVKYRLEGVRSKL